MVCALCGQRRARRACPAVRQDICAVCCGTKREREIDCPRDCEYLGAARAHPASADKQQLQLDLRALIPAVQPLATDEADLFWSLLTFIGSREAGQMLKPSDADVADAAGSLAATFETALKGLIYEHRAASLPAQRLAADVKELLSELGHATPAGFDRRAAAALRAIERSARDAGKVLGPGADVFLSLTSRTARRVQTETAADAATQAARAPSRLIVP